MIKILEKYLFTHILGGTLLVLFVLISLDGLFLFLDEMDDVGKHNYGYLQAFAYVLYSLPARLYEFSSTAILIGSLVGLGSLAANSEITAMRAAGMSRLDLVLALMKVGVIFSLLLFATGEWLIPESQKSAEKNRSEALSNDFSVNQSGGLWLRADEKIIYAKTVVDQTHLSGVKIFTFTQSRLSGLIEAEKAIRNQRDWSLLNVNQLEIEPDFVKVKQQDSMHWPRLLPTGLLETLELKPQAMSLQSLHKYTRYLTDNNLDNATYRFAIWNRFAAPFTILVMLLLVLPFLFVHQRSGGLGQRLFLGIILGTVFFLVNTMVNQVGVVYGLHPAISAFFVPVIATILSIFFIRRIS